MGKLSRSRRKRLRAIAPATPLRSFTKFNDFPFDIRALIWDAAARLPRVIALTFDSDQDFRGRLISKTRRSPLLKTCSESRRAALVVESAVERELDWIQWRSDGQVIYFNGNVDTIVTNSLSMDWFSQRTGVKEAVRGLGEVDLDRDCMNGPGWTEIQRMGIIFRPYEGQSTDMHAFRRWIFTGLRAPVKTLRLNTDSAFIFNNGLEFMLDQDRIFAPDWLAED